MPRGCQPKQRSAGPKSKVFILNAANQIVFIMLLLRFKSRTMMDSNDNELSKSEEPSGSKQNGRWTPQQHAKFVQGVQKFGKNWKRIESVVRTRTGSQIRSHAQKFFNRLDRKYENEQVLNPHEYSESYIQGLEESGVDVERAIFLREKFKKRNKRNRLARLQPISQDECHKHDESQPDRTAQTQRHPPVAQSPSPLALRVFQEVAVDFAPQVFSDIWKIPADTLLSLNFVRTFVDLRFADGRTTGQRNYRPNRSFVPWTGASSQGMEVEPAVQVANNHIYREIAWKRVYY